MLTHEKIGNHQIDLGRLHVDLLTLQSQDLDPLTTRSASVRPQYGNRQPEPCDTTRSFAPNFQHEQLVTIPRNCRTTSTHSSFSTLIPLAPASFSASASRSSSMPVKQTLAPRLAMVCAVHWATGPSPLTSAESPCSRFEARVPQLTPTWANSRPLNAPGRGDGPQR